MFAFPQTSNRLIIGSVTREEKTTQTFDCQDLTFQQELLSPGEDLVIPPMLQLDTSHTLFDHPYFWSADWTSVGLRMETSVHRIAIFFGTIFTQGENPHGRIGAIIGHIVDDGESRTAV